MPAKDIYHQAVIAALVKDGWTITHDPYTLTFGQKDVFVDLGAQQPIAAERADRKIAVEIKSFLGPSDIRELELAIGQYLLYRSLLSRTDGERELYLAVPESVFAGIFSEPIARPVLEDTRVWLMVFEPAKELVIKWIPWKSTGGSSAP